MMIYIVISSGFLIAGWIIAYSIPDTTVGPVEASECPLSPSAQCFFFLFLVRPSLQIDQFLVGFVVSQVTSQGWALVLG